MKSERILRSLGEVSEAYIADAAPPAGGRTKRGWLRWGAMAACLACVVLAGVGIARHAQPTETLPMLTIGDTMQGSMGFEGYMAFNFGELSGAATLDGAEKLKTLPVYRNTLTYDNYGRVSDADPTAMREWLLEVAGRLGMDTESLTVTDNAPDAAEREAILAKFAKVGSTPPEGYFDATAVILEDAQYKVEVSTDMTATICFKQPVTLPEGYEFGHHVPYDSMLRVAEYFCQTYAALIGMDDPQINLTGGDYDIYRRQGYQIEFYEGKGSLTEQLVSRYLQTVLFYPDDEGRLRLARIYRTDLSEKVGDYPIISAEEAKALLLNGNYITTVPEVMPGEVYIAGVELGYRAGARDAYAMPYYRFYVELPGMEQEDGLKTYGAYYVPAVEGRYLTDMPVWDGSFN